MNTEPTTASARCNDATIQRCNVPSLQRCNVPSLHPGRAKIIPPDTLFLPFQVAWINDRSRLKLALKSRQIGWSWATAYSIVTRKATQRARYDAWISSRDDYQARLFLRDCSVFAETLNVAAEDLGQSILVENGTTVYAIQLANGLKIHAMSSSPDAQAGKRGDRILDEFALNPNPQSLYNIAYPGITWGGSLEIISTPRGNNNFFNTLIQEIVSGGNPKRFSFHKVTLEDALAQGLLYKLQSKASEEDPIQQMDEADYFNFVKSGCSTEETFLEEYMCTPIDDKSAFLPASLIASCEYPPHEQWQYTTSQIASVKNGIYLGVDIGRDHDLTVIWALEKIDKIYHTRRVIALKNETFDAQEKVLYELLGLSSVKFCAIDETGMGRQFAERARYRFGKVETIQFTAEKKENLVYPLKRAMEEQIIRLPNDPVIRADLRSVKREHTSCGNVRLGAASTSSGHADRFWALALAFHACSRGDRVYAFVG